MTDCRYLIKRVIKVVIAVLQLILLFLKHQETYLRRVGLTSLTRL